MREAGHRFRALGATPLAPPQRGARALLRDLRAGAGIVLLCGVAAAFGLTGLLSLAAPRYTSSVEILIDPGGLNVVDGDIVDRRPRNDSGVSLIENQVRIVRSDSVLRRVVRRLRLDQDPEFTAPGWVEGVAARLAEAAGLAPDPEDPAEAALDALRRVVAAHRPDQTLIVDVFVETRDPGKSARIADAVGAAYFEEEAASRDRTARRIATSLDGGLPGLKAAIEAVEARILRYRAEHGLVTADGETLGDRQLGTLNREAAAAAIRTAEARQRLDQAKRAPPEEGALPEMLRSRELGGLIQQRAALSRGTAELAARLGARHPALAERAAQERDLRAQIRGEVERVVEGLAREYDRAAASEAAIRAGLASAAVEVAGDERSEVGLRELNRELDARRAVYEAQLRRTREVGEQAQVDSARVRVISPAAPAQVRSWPPAPRFVLPQALALGLVVGAGAALALGRRRRRLRGVAPFAGSDAATAAG